MVVTEGSEPEEYTLKLNENVKQKKSTVAFINLRSRRKSDVIRFGRQMRVVCQDGQEFVLRKQRGGGRQGDMEPGAARGGERGGGDKRGGGDNVIEYYRLIKVDAGGKTCQVAKLSGKGGEAGQTFDIPAFDDKNDKDFIPEENNRGDMMEGDMPGPGPEGETPRPSRRRPPRP